MAGTACLCFGVLLTLQVLFCGCVELLDEEDWLGSGDGFNSSNDITLLASSLKELRVNVNSSVSIPCNLANSDSPIIWARDGRSPNFTYDTKILNNNSLYFERIKEEDAGEYACMRDVPGTQDVFNVRLIVRTPPPALLNVTVHPSTILAMARWEVGEDGGYPICSFHIRYKPVTNSTWISPIQLHHLPPTQRLVEIYHLYPNSSYELEIWATNELGRGKPTVLHFRTHYDESEIELARYMTPAAGASTACVLAVSITLGSVALVLAIGLLMVWRRHRWNSSMIQRAAGGPANDSEIIELIPNIIVNPGYYPADENCNAPAPAPINNNTVIHPHRV